jgi:SAM-dependent methyltransferase
LQQLNFENSYFENRLLNDKRRLQSFKLEEKIILKFITKESTVCDIGCSTGEFLDFLKWEGKKYGIEINEFAKSQALMKGVDIVPNLDSIQTGLNCVILRGTLQHLPSPFLTLSAIYEKLEPGGFLFILATPNVDSIYYRIFHDLPAFDFPRNYWLTGVKNIKIVCEREGFEIRDLSFPYRHSGYISILDIPKFILRLITRHRRFGAAFPGNMINLVLQKPKNINESD